MDKNSIAKAINAFNTLKNKDANISLVQKLRRKDEKYFFYTATILDDIKNDISSILLDGFCDCLSAFELREYDPLYVHENTIEYMPISDIPTYDIFKSELNGPNNTSMDPNEIDISKINFYYCCIKDIDSGKEALFFKNYRNPKMLRNHMPLKLIDNTLRKIENLIFYLDPISDLFIFDGYIYIYNRNSLNTVFDYKDEFLRNLDIALTVIEDNNIINNFEEFKEDCEQSMLIARKFTRILRKREENFNVVVKNFDKVPSILEKLNIDIKFDDDNKIIYENKEDLNVIATIFSDGFARTFICERDIIAGEDEEINQQETVVLQ